MPNPKDLCPFVREGMLVGVVEGPLKGVVGRLIHKGAHAPLILPVELLNWAVSVSVDAGDVRLL